jgi:hypothetical protein
MLMSFGVKGGWVEHQILNTNYCVKSSTPIVDTGVGAMNEQFRCLKLSIANASSNEVYDLERSTKWSVSALHVDNDWKLISEIRLELKD